MLRFFYACDGDHVLERFPCRVTASFDQLVMFLALCWTASRNRVPSIYAEVVVIVDRSLATAASSFDEATLCAAVSCRFTQFNNTKPHNTPNILNVIT